MGKYLLLSIDGSIDIYRQQKVLSHFPVCCWIDCYLMIKNCLIESGPSCRSMCNQMPYTSRFHNRNFVRVPYLSHASATIPLTRQKTVV
jgi:hypothetical protein